MHVWTRLSERWKDKTGLGVYADGMQELNWVVGELVGKLDELGIADNTVVVFATDNGAEKFTMAAPHHFAARRASVGRAASARHSSFAGPARSLPTRCSTALCPWRTWCRP
jgi:arylsulfatase A-like enzyme